MACLTKNLIRIGVIGALVVGAGVVVAGPHRVCALFTQARQQINASIDGHITDPVALRSQLRDLEGQYPKRIASVRADLRELQAQIAQLNRELEVSHRVVALADTDLDQINSGVAQADQAVTQQVAVGGFQQVLIVFKGDRLTVEAANAKAGEITNTRNAYASRAADVERDLGYLAQQEQRLTTLLAKLETEQTEFQTQLWELDRKIDAVARNDRMIEILAKRQQSIDEQSRYQATSLDQLNSRLADIKAKQESKLAALTVEQNRTNYEDVAKSQIDREMSAKRLYEQRTGLPAAKAKPSVIEVRPKADSHQQGPPAPEKHDSVAAGNGAR